MSGISIVTLTWIFVGFFEALGRIDEFKMQVSLTFIIAGIVLSVAFGHLNPDKAVFSVVSWFSNAIVGALVGEVLGELAKSAMGKR